MLMHWVRGFRGCMCVRVRACVCVIVGRGAVACETFDGARKAAISRDCVHPSSGEEITTHRRGFSFIARILCGQTGLGGGKGPTPREVGGGRSRA